MKTIIGKEKVGSSSSQILPFQRVPPFFRLYLPELHSHKMLIPSDFIKYFKGTIPKEVTLKNLKGKIWRVKVELVKGKGVYLTDGWEKYKNNHSLLRGYFLVFELIESYSYEFIVKVFGSHGCIIEEPTHVENVGVYQVANTSTRPIGTAGFTKKDSRSRDTGKKLFLA